MTAPGIHLTPLVCVQCRQPILAQPTEVAWVCETCGSGNLLESDGQVRLLQVFYSPALKSGVKGRPFWVSQGRVSISSRQTYKGDESRTANEFWSGPRLFCIPAFQISLQEIVSTGMKMLREPGFLQQAAGQPESGSKMPFVPVTTPPEDMQPLAEFIVLAIEADRRDALKTVNFHVQLETPQLWVLP